MLKLKKPIVFKSFEKKEFWLARCCKCGEYYNFGDVLTVFDNKEEAKDVIESDNSWTIKNGRIYCGECG
jgi:hypothetical protein